MNDYFVKNIKSYSFISFIFSFPFEKAEYKSHQFNVVQHHGCQFKVEEKVFSLSFQVISV